jgi:hypothetical protein
MNGTAGRTAAALLVLLAGAAAGTAGGDDGVPVAYDPAKPAHRSALAHEARWASWDLAGEPLGLPLSATVRLGRRYRCDGSIVLAACLRGEGGDAESGRKALRRKVRRRLGKQGIGFATKETEREALSAWITKVARTGLREELELLRKLTDQGIPDGEMHLWYPQESGRTADPVRNPAGLVVADPFLDPGSPLLREADLPAEELAEYRRRMLVAVRIFEASVRRRLEADDRAHPWELARALRIHEHAVALYGAEALGKEGARTASLVRGELRRRREESARKVGHLVDALAAGRVPPDEDPSTDVDETCWSAVTSILHGSLEHVFWGVRLGEGWDLPWPEERVVAAIRFATETHRDALAERQRPTDHERKVAVALAKLEEDCQDGLLARLRREVRASPCIERVGVPLWILARK